LISLPTCWNATTTTTPTTNHIDDAVALNDANQIDVLLLLLLLLLLILRQTQAKRTSVAQHGQIQGT